MPNSQTKTVMKAFYGFCAYLEVLGATNSLRKLWETDGNGNDKFRSVLNQDFRFLIR
jgi:hypothetical protein